MAWADEMVPTLRVMVGDLSETTPTYADARLEQVLLVAAKQVLASLEFASAYRVSVANGTLAPDPTATATKDDSFVNLVTIKAACILDHNAAILAARQAIAVKDGSSAIDLRGNLVGKLKLLEKGWCAVYADAVFEYQTSAYGAVAGAAVMTPFRLYANGGFASHFADARGRDVL